MKCIIQNKLSSHQQKIPNIFQCYLNEAIQPTLFLYMQFKSANQISRPRKLISFASRKNLLSSQTWKICVK